MLINTLFLFLREMLPLFLFTTMVLILFFNSNLGSSLLLRSLGFGIALGLCLLPIIDSISMGLDGRGLELLFFMTTLLQMICFLVVIIDHAEHHNRAHSLIAIILVLMSMTASVHFISYFTVLWQTQPFSQALVLGTAVGVGISASLAILLYFLLRMVHQNFPLVIWYLSGWFLSAQLAVKTNLLAQIGLIDAEIVWSTEAWLSEQTVLGYLFRSLIGYEATPIYWQLYCYLFSIGLVFFLIKLKAKNLSSFLREKKVSL